MTGKKGGGHFLVASKVPTQRTKWTIKEGNLKYGFDDHPLRGSKERLRITKETDRICRRLPRKHQTRLLREFLARPQRGNGRTLQVNKLIQQPRGGQRIILGKGRRQRTGRCQGRDHRNDKAFQNKRGPRERLGKRDGYHTSVKEKGEYVGH